MKVLKVILYSTESEKEKKEIQEWNIEQGKSYLIGRNPDKTNITISDGTISRIHAELSCTTDGKLFITDLGSANGTFVNDEQIGSQKKIQLYTNYKINLGDSNFFLIVSESEPEQITKPSHSSKDLAKVRDNDRKIRDVSKNKSVSSSSSKSFIDRDRRGKSRDNRSKRYHKGDEKLTYRHREKRGDRHRRSKRKSNSNSNHKWKKTGSHSRRRSRSKSITKMRSRKYNNSKHQSKEKVSNINELEKDIQKNSKVNEIKHENLKENHPLNKMEDKKESYAYRKHSLADEKKKEFIDEELKEEIERKTKYYEEFLKLKESDSSDLKLKLPKLIDKEKQNPSDIIDVTSKPNLTVAFKKLEENNQLKGIKNTYDRSYAKHGNNNFNIHRRESFDNNNRLENKYDNRGYKNYSNGSRWKKHNY